MSLHLGRCSRDTKSLGGCDNAFAVWNAPSPKLCALEVTWVLRAPRVVSLNRRLEVSSLIG